MRGTVGLLLAAGSGTRLGRRAKAFVELAGEPLFLYGLRAMTACSRLTGIVVLVPDDHVDVARTWTETLPAGFDVVIRSGGHTRQDSVRRGLDALSGQVDVVVCHDAARPLATPALFERVLDRLGRGEGAGRGGGTGSPGDWGGVDGVVPVVPSPDTVKRIKGGLVIETIPRDELGLAQTPQAFKAAALADAHSRGRPAGRAATDDAVLLEAAGYTVATVEGEPANFKVTTPDDLHRAEACLAELGAVGRMEGRG